MAKVDVFAFGWLSVRVAVINRFCKHSSGVAVVDLSDTVFIHLQFLDKTSAQELKWAQTISYWVTLFSLGCACLIGSQCLDGRRRKVEKGVNTE